MPNSDMPRWARVFANTSIVVAALLLATFFSQPTLDWHTCHWAAPVMHQHIPECDR